MALRVSEIMNPELFSIRGEERARRVLDGLLRLGITAAPVLDDGLRPVGIVSVRDLLRAPDTEPALLEMSTTPTTVPATATIEEAAEKMAGEDRRHLIVVDDDGRAVGFVSALDVVRGLIGRPARHPQGFPHYDPGSGLAWSNPVPLASENLGEAPRTPGVVRLLRGGKDREEVAVWSEVTGDVGERLEQLCGSAPGLPPALLVARDDGSLRFQLATMPTALPGGAD